MSHHSAQTFDEQQLSDILIVDAQRDHCAFLIAFVCRANVVDCDFNFLADRFASQQISSFLAVISFTVVLKIWLPITGQVHLHLLAVMNNLQTIWINNARDRGNKRLAYFCFVFIV